ncbi:MAG TPA: ACT domain-containing protein [Anaerolineales bacterium]|nr:ACT domain-containing protein [Anaerolineales bacterium]
MPGETNLQKLLQGMKPKLNNGEFVFCIVDTSQNANALNPLCLFQETEGVTVIIPKQQADDAALPYSVVCSWITLTVHSSLEAVGLTAAVSKALTDENISCNIVAAYYHDHIFVPVQDANRAMEVLENLSAKRE